MLENKTTRLFSKIQGTKLFLVKPVGQTSRSTECLSYTSTHCHCRLGQRDDHIAGWKVEPLSRYIDTDKPLCMSDTKALNLFLDQLATLRAVYEGNLIRMGCKTVPDHAAHDGFHMGLLVMVCMGLMAYQVYTMRIKMANMEASTEMRFLNELSQELPAIKDEAKRYMGKTKRELMSHMATLHQSVESQLSTLEARVPDDLSICEGPSVSETPTEPAGGQTEGSSESDTEE